MTNPKFRIIWFIPIVIAIAAVALFFILNTNDGVIRINREIPGLGNRFRMELLELPEQPARFHGEVQLSKGDLPFWATSFRWNLGLTEDQISTHFTREYIQTNGAPKLNQTAQGWFNTIFYAVHLTTKEGEFIVTVCAPKPSEDIPNISDSGISILKKEEGIWKISSFPEWSSYFPWKKPEVIKQIIRDRKAHVNQYNRLEPL